MIKIVGKFKLLISVLNILKWDSLNNTDTRTQKSNGKLNGKLEQNIPTTISQNCVFANPELMTIPKWQQTKS